VKVVDPDEEVPHEVLATSIVKLSEGAERLLAGPLNERALILLLHDSIPAVGRPPRKPTKSDIKAVLLALPALRRRYLKGVKRGS
jgi:hypothetical protein